MEIIDIPLGLGRETYCEVDPDDDGRDVSLAIEEHRPAWTAQGWREYAQVRLSVDAARQLREALGEIIERIEAKAAAGQFDMFRGRAV